VSRRPWFVSLAAGALAACATVPKTPAQTIYALEGQYAAALAVAAAYHDLPECPKAVVCKDMAVMPKLLGAVLVANKTLLVAEDVVRGKSPGDTAAAVASAAIAVGNLRVIVSPLKVK
jgi:hypothetical protein